jgi:tripartite-type tricarboxylate transporter receptor subunit TctC
MGTILLGLPRLLSGPQIPYKGVAPAGNTPQAFQSFIERELERWTVVVKAAGTRAA